MRTRLKPDIQQRLPASFPSNEKDHTPEYSTQGSTLPSCEFDDQPKQILTNIESLPQ